MSPSACFDAHNHLQQFDDTREVIDAMRRADVTGCVVNGTCEDDWPRVAALARAHPDFVVPAFGLHPWFAHRRSPRWLDTLRSHLDEFPRASIGECGLDGWVGTPDLETQREVFLAQIVLARERRLPLTVHALKAWQALADALSEEPPPESGFLLHSFGGNPELAEQFAKLGARFSFSGYFLHPRKARVLDAYRRIPPDRLLLETDAPNMAPPDDHITHPRADGENHPANLPAIARALAARLDTPFDTLAVRCRENARAFFATPG